MHAADVGATPSDAEQVLDLADRESRRRGVTIGVYPETKHPTYFDSLGLSLEEPLVAALKRHHLNRPNAPVSVQLVDESGAPYDLVAQGDGRTYRDLVTPAGLRDVATYADVLGADKELVLPRDANGDTGAPSAVVGDAHDEGLAVHVWTLRRENQFMARNFRVGTDPVAVGDLRAEIRAFLAAGVDGVFSDNPDLAVDARDAWADTREPAAARRS